MVEPDKKQSAADNGLSSTLPQKHRVQDKTAAGQQGCFLVGAISRGKAGQAVFTVNFYGFCFSLIGPYSSGRYSLF